MKNLFAAFIALLLPVMAAAQFSVSGKITNQQTGEALPGATIALANSAEKIIADAGGRYHIDNLKSRSYALTVSFIGYQATTKKIEVNANVVSDFALQPATTFLLMVR
ncbi:MAG: carboxypeptidase-like regulatory domain-containing protein [Mucilaginibacter sp.]